MSVIEVAIGPGREPGRYRVEVAAHSGEGLRVVLRIDDPALAGLPWEAMYDEALGSYVCRRNQLVRHVGVPSSAAPLPVTAPLRILGIVSSPRGLAPLDVDKEKDQLTRALARVTADGLVELVWSASATWTDLQDTLLSGEWHVMHFIGHGDFDAEHDQGVLALTGEDGRMHLVQASRLVDLLRQAHPVPKLVVLNSCSRSSRARCARMSRSALVRVLSGHQGGAMSVAFAPDSALLASSGNDAMVRLWDPASGMQTQALHDSEREAAAYPGPGRRGFHERRGLQPGRDPGCRGWFPDRAAVGNRERDANGSPARSGRQGVECDVQPGRNPRRVGQRRRDGAGVGLTHQDSGPSGPAHAPPSVLDKDLD
jgi:hypothetical protein